MADSEETSNIEAGLAEIQKMKIEKSKVKSAFTRSRNQLLDALQSVDIDRATVNEAWAKVDKAQMTAQTLMTALSEQYIEMKDNTAADQVIEEIEVMEKEFGEANKEVRRVRMELFRVNARPDSGNAGLAIGESRPLISGDSPNDDQNSENSENDEMGSFRGRVTRPTEQASHSLGQDMWKQLKRVTIPVFDGDIKVFENWKAAFMSCIDNAPATPEYKLLQLRQYLSGEAHRCIESLGHSAAAYEAAKKRLERKYGGKRRQIALQFEELHNFKPIRPGNSKDVEKFADLLDITIINLKDSGLYSELDSRLLYMVLVKKMTESMVTQYQRWLRESQQQESIEVLKNWVIKEAEYRTVAYEAIRGINELVVGGNEQRSGRRARTFVTSGQGRSCKQCSGPHGVWACEEVKSMTVTERWQLTKQTGLCFRCLGDNHRGQNCPRSRVCGINGCKRTHHRLLHDRPPQSREYNVDKSVNRPPTEGERYDQKSIRVDDCSSIGTQTATVMSGAECKGKYVALRTVPVIVKNGKKRIKVNALLDDASTSTFINSDVAAELGLQGKSEKTEVSVLNGQIETFETIPVEFGLESLDRSVDIIVSGKTTDKVTGDMRAVDWDIMARKWHHLKDVKFPKFGKRSKIDLLIGVDLIDLHYSMRDICGKPGEPIARRTRLGWTCIGQPMRDGEFDEQTCFVRTYFTHNSTMTDESELNWTIRQFWQVERYGVGPTGFTLKSEDTDVIKEAKCSLKYDNGRYQVGVPWKSSDEVYLPDNMPLAVSRLESTERRLLSNPELGRSYSKVIEDYLRKGYIHKVTGLEAIGEGQKWYLPHFPVVRPDKATTKTRLVFDASAKFKGVSLNDKIKQGPKLQRELFDVLLRFRKGSVAIVCDITEMYLQIRLQPSDRSYHRFLWRDLEQTRPPEEYEFERVVFGVNASPFMAQFVVQEHAKSHQAELPMAAETVLKSTYMDDSMDSVPDVESGCELYNQLSKLWGSAGMHARKWLSNSPEVLACIPPEDRAAEISLEEGELPSVKTLGVLWQSKEDVFAFQPNPPPADYKLTKRSILRKLATIFDPLGFISPFIVRGKIIIQELWAAGLEWDEPVVGDLAGKVDKWFKEISILRNVQLPRCLRLDEAMEFMSLHCFVDASQEAYGGVVYAITKYKSGHIESRLIASKTRVAPLSATSVPRLELMAAVLGLRLAISIVGALELSIRDVTFWSDSMNVLWWVCRQSRKFKPFVANRVGEIQEMTEPKQWRYVPTNQNPADLLSRGMKASDLVNGKFWWSGPGFLKQAESKWPENKVESGSKEEDRKQGTVSVSMLTMTPAHSTDCQKSFRLEPSRYSDWSKYIRVRSWVQRFLDNCRSPEPGRRKGELCPEELRQSEKCVIRGAQRSAFPNEYQALLNGRLITASSKILSLNPKLDDEALLRCDGRLRNADFLSYDARYPIILPRKNWVTKLIVKQFHDERHHVGGTNQILADLSSKYWIIAAREEIRDWERECFGCKRLKAKTASQIMAPLPSIRVKLPLRAFARTSVDFAGPFLAKQGRGRIQLKRYLCLFTCLSSRAVHLEMAYGLDTDSFLNALNRMINRRGVPVEMISDNGTNFKGAEKELRELVDRMDKDKITRSTANQMIKWHFNPPLSPHFGGVHETMIKAAKKAIKNVVYKADITDEELTTVFTGAEALLNSRPLTYQSADSQDDIPLTPNHFLHGQAGGQFAVDAVDDGSFSPRKRWRRVQELVRHFWHRWLKEWLPLLNQRRKWRLPQRDFKVGDVVIVYSSDTPRGSWPLGRIVEVLPGVDGHVRVVRVQVGKKILTRSISRLCPLLERD